MIRLRGLIGEEVFQEQGEFGNKGAVREQSSSVDPEWS